MNLKDFKEDILPFKNKLFRLALRMVNDAMEAEDIVQEVFIKLWKNKKDLDHISNLEAWAMRMTKNLTIDKLRMKGRNQESIDNNFTALDKNASPYELAVRNDTFSHIKGMMNQLPDKQKSIMHLRDIEGMSYQEIAEILDLPLNQVKVNLFRARKQIKTQILESKIFQI